MKFSQNELELAYEIAQKYRKSEDDIKDYRGIFRLAISDEVVKNLEENSLYGMDGFYKKDEYTVEELDDLKALSAYYQNDLDDLMKFGDDEKRIYIGLKGDKLLVINDFVIYNNKAFPISEENFDTFLEVLGVVKLEQSEVVYNQSIKYIEEFPNCTREDVEQGILRIEENYVTGVKNKARTSEEVFEFLTGKIPFYHVEQNMDGEIFVIHHGFTREGLEEELLPREFLQNTYDSYYIDDTKPVKVLKLR